MKNNYLFTICLLLMGGFGFAQDRVTCCETFTSSTCPPCNPGNIQLENILGDPVNDGNHISIKYQMSWPGSGDPYYTDEGNSRRSYYGVSGVPETHLDGGAGFNPGSMTQSQLDATVSVAPKCTMTALYQVNVSTQTVDIQVEIIALEDFPGGCALQTAIIEYTTDNNVKSNGETEFYNVMKKMIPGSGGSLMIGVDAGDTVNFDLSYTFNGSYVLPPDADSPIDHTIEHSIEEFSDLGVVCWVQRITSKEVLNATQGVNSAVGLDELNAEVVSAKIYPNPAVDNVAIAFQTTEETNITISIVNTVGQVVYTNTISNVQPGRTVEDVNTSDFANGLYLVNITSDSGNITKKLNIRK